MSSYVGAQLLVRVNLPHVRKIKLLSLLNAKINNLYPLCFKNKRLNQKILKLEGK